MHDRLLLLLLWFLLRFSLIIRRRADKLISFLQSKGPIEPASKPAPLTSVEALLNGTSTGSSEHQESPIAQIRSSVEKQMNQLQQELLTGFPHASQEMKKVGDGDDVLPARLILTSPRATF